MSAPIQADAVNDWFRHVGTSMSREDYEAGIKVIADLVELNRRLANQVVGITDRVNDSIGGIVKAAKEAAWDAGYTTGNAHNGRRDANPFRADQTEEP